MKVYFSNFYQRNEEVYKHKLKITGTFDSDD